MRAGTPTLPFFNTMKKSIFKSKTALIAFLTSVAGAVSHFYPEANTIVSENASTILLVLGAVNMGVRAITKEKVTLFPK